ncbi:MAG TPA: hypothetical protein VGX25_26510 [Actinophytocola sp.]|uniref:globin domain-containing protein n=1 Tax=Actinophytocola sp. TaxID=1872138 RepID=UPI002DDD16CE|nr:hypothetical protein [Actinophytocola sp.]HEV2782957.1 hypothetical protein [Actinophytocola sp.]
MTPTLYEWAGGAAALRKLFERFYERVRADDLLAPVFAGMDPEHPSTLRPGWARSSAGPRTTRPRAAGTPTWSGATSAGR